MIAPAKGLKPRAGASSFRPNSHLYNLTYCQFSLIDVDLKL